MENEYGERNIQLPNIMPHPGIGGPWCGGSWEWPPLGLAAHHHVLYTPVHYPLDVIPTLILDVIPTLMLFGIKFSHEHIRATPSNI